jgi:tetratricopeptide (TPR) repeat protein
MLTKQIAFTLPLAVGLYEFMFFKGRKLRRMLWLVPVFLTMLIIPLTLMGVGRPLPEMMGDIGDKTAIRDMPRLEYLFTEFRVIVTYLRLLLLPINQNLDYDYQLYQGFFEPAVSVSFLFLLGLFGLGVYLYRRSRVGEKAGRLVAFGIFWFFITLSVESSIIPLHVIYEHRVYLPSVGAFLAAATAACVLLRGIGNRKLGAGAVLSFVLILSAFSYAAFARNAVWKSEISLWSDVLKKSPMKAGGHMELAIACRSKGLTVEAVKHYKTALMLEPKWADAHYNLGVAYLELGQTEKAYGEFKMALQIRPDFAGARRFIEHIEKFNR